MPFVEQTHRNPEHLPCCVGDQCYIEYKKLIDAFRADRRWTTAHNLTKDWFELSDDEETAHFLAYMVFFCKEVLKYEDEKEKANGSI